MKPSEWQTFAEKFERMLRMVLSAEIETGVRGRITGGTKKERRALAGFATDSTMFLMTRELREYIRLLLDEFQRERAK